MKLKTESHQKTFNHIANFLGIKPNGPGSFFLSAWLAGYSESRLAETSVFQIGHSAGWNGCKLVFYIKDLPAGSRAGLESYSESELADVAAFVAAYQKTFGRPISGQI